MWCYENILKGIWLVREVMEGFTKEVTLTLLSVEEFTEAVGKVCQQRGPQVRQEGTKHTEGN